MRNPLPWIAFILLATAGFAAFQPENGNPVFIALFAVWLIVSAYVAGALRIAAQWEKVLVFRLGRFRSVRGPGFFTILPLVDSVRSVDTRIMTLAIPRQEAITKDNVPVSLDGVIFLRVSDPADAIIQVQNFEHAIRQYSQTALRDVIGSVTLDEILADREGLGKRIEEMVETEIVGWGLEVAGIRIQDIVLPEDLKRVMARQAAAEREKRANITKSEGDKLAATNLADAARTMATSPGALQLRTLQTLDTLGNSSSNTVVLTVPVDVMTALQSVPKLVQAIQGTSTPQSDENPDLEKNLLSARPKATDEEQGEEVKRQI